MKNMLVPIDQAGRIVLPKNIREELSIKAGDTFKVSIQGAAVTLTPKTESSGFVRKGRALVFSATGGGTITSETVEDILNAGRNEREASSRERLLRRKPAA